jgi:hypothetical protein
MFLKIVGPSLWKQSRVALKLSYEDEEEAGSKLGLVVLVLVG